MESGIEMIGSAPHNLLNHVTYEDTIDKLD